MRMNMKATMTRTKMMKWVLMLALQKSILRMRNDFNDGMGWLHRLVRRENSE